MSADQTYSSSSGATPTQGLGQLSLHLSILGDTDWCAIGLLGQADLACMSMELEPAAAALVTLAFWRCIAYSRS